MKAKKRTIKGLPPNTQIVAVKRNLCAKAKFYPVFSVQGYLNKCAKENKIAYYVGRTNKKGELVI